MYVFVLTSYLLLLLLLLSLLFLLLLDDGHVLDDRLDVQHFKGLKHNSIIYNRI